MRNELEQLLALTQEEHEEKHGATSSVGCADTFPSRGRHETQGAFLVPEDAARQLSMQVEQLGRIVSVLARKMEDMEKDAARRVTVSHAQALALSRQIKGRAAAVCAEYGLAQSQDAAAFRKAIKKDVLERFGVRDLHDMPLACLDAAAERVARYMSIALVMERRSKHDGHDGR